MAREGHSRQDAQLGQWREQCSGLGPEIGWGEGLSLVGTKLLGALETMTPGSISPLSSQQVTWARHQLLYTRFFSELIMALWPFPHRASASEGLLSPAD